MRILLRVSVGAALATLKQRRDHPKRENREWRITMGALVLYLVIISIIMGCGVETSSKKAHGEMLKSWIGRDANEVLRTWGPPTETLRLPNGNTLFVYDRQGSAVTLQPTSRDPLRGTFPGDVTSFICRTRMEVDTSGRIVQGTYQGDC